jgi:dTDP-4-dehydro-6-deoxy-alpha-D-glucopyranose 2,3-dehydratase
VQCITGSYHHSLKVLPYLEYVLTAREDQIRHSSLQSEEGGRFFHEQNRHLIVEADERFPLECPENYQWMTLSQLLTFARFNNYLNIQARSLLATLRLA